MLVDSYRTSYNLGDMAHKFLPNNRKLLDYEGERVYFAMHSHSQMNFCPFVREEIHLAILFF
jgi:hypothetical protein